MKPISLVITCEHASNQVPTAFKDLFLEDEEILNTHRGYDIGAAEIAQSIAQHFSCDYVKATVTRLLIDCNRTLNKRNCFSSFTRSLPKHFKQQLIDDYYLPFRNKAHSIIAEKIHQGAQVLHLSIHSFTPDLKGVARKAAIGLLYDSKRHGEKEVARIWHEILLTESPDYRIRMNYPYQGSSDGFTSALRKQYHQENYLGIELESNQILLTDPNPRAQLIQSILDSLDTLKQILS